MIVAGFVRIFLFEAYTIPTPSMQNTLLVDDYIFVSKIHYGPRLPMTPLSIPFTQNTLPGSGKNAYIEGIKLPYKRLHGFNGIKRNDVVVFNFPEGDTVLSKNDTEASYYELCRVFGKQYVHNKPDKYGQVQYRPVDKRTHFIKRCIGLPGDTISIDNGIVRINRKKSRSPEGLLYDYQLKITNDSLPGHFMKSYGIKPEQVSYKQYSNTYNIALNPSVANALDTVAMIKGIRKYENKDYAFANINIFPHSHLYRWTEDNYGPLKIPAANDTIKLNNRNIELYSRIIRNYEKNDLQLRNGKIFVNDTATDSYIVKMNYYFVMGDNRHSSSDSRFWGFLPENHIIGKAWMTFLSIDDSKKSLDRIRWKRMFKIIR
jgi:signal peptidase I